MAGRAAEPESLFPGGCAEFALWGVLCLVTGSREVSRQSPARQCSSSSARLAACGGRLSAADLHGATRRYWRVAVRLVRTDLCFQLARRGSGRGGDVFPADGARYPSGAGRGGYPVRTGRPHAGRRPLAGIPDHYASAHVTGHYRRYGVSLRPFVG